MSTSTQTNSRIYMSTTSPDSRLKLQAIANEQSISLSACAGQMADIGMKHYQEQKSGSGDHQINLMLTAILKETIQTNALLGHFLDKHLKPEEVAKLERACDEAFNRIFEGEDND